MYIFNSDHDLALANFSTNYTSPASAVKMMKDLAILPIWYADGETVVADGELNNSFMEELKDKLPVSSRIIPFKDINQYSDEDIIPWGWNPSFKKKLFSLGVSESQLPGRYIIEKLRVYSHRKNAVEFLKELQAEFPDFKGESNYFTELEGLLEYLDSFPGDKVLKMPLSGSGKGLVWILGGITDKQTDWCRRVIRQQGGVVAEPVLDKVADFAMEFYIDRGAVSFAGYSLFLAAKSGAYIGNELLSDSNIEAELSKYTSVDLLHKLRKSLIEKLSHHFPEYTGYAGVDMMVCKNNNNEDEKYFIQPCVEINMRMNMGVVSRLFHDRFMLPDGKGRFIVEYFKKPGSALAFHEKLQRESTLKMEKGKLSSGYLSLTPVNIDTLYVAYVLLL